MHDRIKDIFRESARVKESFLSDHLDALCLTVETMAEVLSRGNKILLFGNGGSAADAQHLAAEFVNRFVINRRPLPAIALTTDSSIITAVSNDFSYNEIFSKQITALGLPGDAAVGISTSGASPNVLRGLEVAQAANLVTVGFGGPANGPMAKLCKHYLGVEADATARIQEVHELIGHTIVELVDEQLFGSDP